MLSNKRQTSALVEVFKRHGKTRTYKKGDYIIHPGELPPGVFYITAGLVKAYDITKYGEENLLIIRRNDEIFPLIWAMTGQERQVIYQALAPTTAWQISRECFETEIMTHSAAVMPLLDMTIEMYRLHSERILNLEYRSVRERIVSFLLTMASRFGSDTPEGLVIDAPLRHQDIASSINASRETTSRELANLERKGFLDGHRSKIILLDLEGLKALVQ